MNNITHLNKSNLSLSRHFVLIEFFNMCLVELLIYLKSNDAQLLLHIFIAGDLLFNSSV